MKAFKYIIKSLFISVIMFAGSCSEDFIDVPPLGLLSDANFDPVPAVTSCYNIMGNYDNRWSDWRILITGDVLSDDAWKGGSSQTDQIDLHQMNIFATIPSNIIVRDHWALYYRRIFRFNWAIHNLERLDQSNELISRLTGEVKYLRAMHYFWLSRIFGEIPLIDRPLTPNDHNQTRQPMSEVYSFINEAFPSYSKIV
jgi:starch-binding outer membrane protein, SusD/RagB family